MLSAPHNRHVNMEWRGYVMPHDRRIAAISGQPFGDAYYEGLLRSEARLDSTAHRRHPGRAQTGHCATAHAGRRASRPLPARPGNRRPAVLAGIAAELGADAGRFADAYAAALERSATHIAHSRQLMNRLELRGFPSAVLEQDGRFEQLDLGAYLGRPEAFRQYLQQNGAAHAETGQAPQCGLDGC